MCNPLALTAASATVSVLGQMQAGNDANRQAQAQAAQLDYSAAVTRDDALAQAQMIRKAAKRDLSTADTITAASGVVVGDGSSAEVERGIRLDSEHDAYLTIMNGERRARGEETQAGYTRQAGANAKANAPLNAAASVLGAGASYFKTTGWKTGTDSARGLPSMADFSDR